MSHAPFPFWASGGGPFQVAARQADDARRGATATHQRADTAAFSVVAFALQALRGGYRLLLGGDVDLALRLAPPPPPLPTFTHLGISLWGTAIRCSTTTASSAPLRIIALKASGLTDSSAAAIASGSMGGSRDSTLTSSLARRPRTSASNNSTALMCPPPTSLRACSAYTRGMSL